MSIKKYSPIAGVAAGLLLFAGTAMAQSGGIGQVADTARENLEAVANLIQAASYVAGLGFALSGFFKLKAHKDQPAQVPLSQPITLLVIAAGLFFLPSMINSVGATLFGSSGQKSSLSGGDI